MIIFQNVINNFILLKGDFIGISFNFLGIGYFFNHLFIACFILFSFYLLGNKIYKKIFKDKNPYKVFICFALGYILVSTAVGFLGIISLLQTRILTTFFLIVFLFSFYPFHYDFKNFNLNIIFTKFKNYFGFKNNFLTWGVLLFIIIALLRLITPEIAEDGYHTDLVKLYITTGTSIHETKDLLHVIPYPQLPEMTYLIAMFIGDREVTRFLHFGFYLLIILLLFRIARQSEYSFAKYVPLIFVTTPLVIRYSSSQYTDFFMLFCFILSMVLIRKNMLIKQIILSGILWGAVLSTKMWMLVYMPMLILYILFMHFQSNLLKILRILAIFIGSALLVVGIWYLRAFIITGNPIYPIFSELDHVEIAANMPKTQMYQYVGLNKGLLYPETLMVFSPLFFFSLLMAFFYFKDIFYRVRKAPLFIIFLLLTFVEIFVKIYLGRYLFAWYSIFSIIVAASLVISIEKQKILKYCFVSLYVILFIYYFLNTLFILPYGFGWANKNKYLTRVLGRDNVSYYDFNKLFDKQINNKDLVATYGIASFYYANFDYIDVGYIFGKDKRSVDLLKKRMVTKLLIKGGDFEWFCKELGLTGCNSQKVKLLATYPRDLKKYNLYLIQY